MILNFPNRRVGSLAMPQAGDADISIPNTLQPMVELPGPISTSIAISGFTPQTEPVQADSHVISCTRTQPASTATAQVGITRLKAGIWRIVIHATTIGTFLPGTQLTAVQLLDPGQISNTTIVDLSFASGVVTKDFTDFIFSPPVDNWEFLLQQGITAAGQSIFSNVILIANRIG